MNNFSRYFQICGEIFLYFSLLLIPINLSGQQILFPRTIDSTEFVSRIDSFNNKFGINKTIPDDLQLSCLIALTHYPELDSTKVIFKNRKIKTTLNTRPTLFSTVFKNRNNRNYVIRINRANKPEIISVYQVSFNGKIGLFGHEFAHISDYKQANICGILKRAIFYLFNKSKKKYENRIDKIAIDKGFGWQLYDWSYFVLYESNATDKYKAFKRKICLTPEQIFEIINKN